MKNKIIKILATFFGVGYLPLIPGTWGAGAGMLIYIFFLSESLFLHTFFLLVITICGFLVSGRCETIFGEKDANVIVIDEVAGILLTFLFLPFKTIYLFLGFFLFRLFDTIKPPPTEAVERLPGSSGIMSDDLIAGFYSNICLQIAHLFLPR